LVFEHDLVIIKSMNTYNELHCHYWMLEIEDAVLKDDEEDPLPQQKIFKSMELL